MLIFVVFILDPIGTTYLAENILSLEKGGRIIYYGTLISDTLFLQNLMESEITIRSALVIYIRHSSSTDGS